jgi:adenine deaminase
VKYGRTEEQEALNFVTINPARQLRIDNLVGSLEPGKDGDFVIWSGSPLDSQSVCLQTWIEGAQYFERDQETQRTESQRQERDELLAKARRVVKDKKPKDDAGSNQAEEKFFRICLEHRYDGINRHCMDHDHE